MHNISGHSPFSQSRAEAPEFNSSSSKKGTVAKKRDRTEVEGPYEWSRQTLERQVSPEEIEGMFTHLTNEATRLSQPHGDIKKVNDLFQGRNRMPNLDDFDFSFT